MPSASELRAIGRNDLACAISKRGGFRLWAETLDLALKGTETHRGLEAEDVEIEFLKSKGFQVKRQTTRAPFDLLVNGWRIDVKSGKPSVYGNSKTKVYVGWIFRLAKVPATCDFYLLVCQDKSGSIERRYLIPAGAARITMLTITPCGKYEGFRDAFDQLR